MKTSFILIFFLALLLSTHNMAVELLPFPQENRPQENRPFVLNNDQQALRDFTRRIDSLDCVSLRGVRNGLIERVNNSRTLSDKDYYQKRLDVVESASNNLNCP